MTIQDERDQHRSKRVKTAYAGAVDAGDGNEDRNSESSELSEEPDESQNGDGVSEGRSSANSDAVRFRLYPYDLTRANLRTLHSGKTKAIKPSGSKLRKMEPEDIRTKRNQMIRNHQAHPCIIVIWSPEALKIRLPCGKISDGSTSTLKA